MRWGLLGLMFLGASLPSYGQLYECKDVVGYTNRAKGDNCRVIRGFTITPVTRVSKVEAPKEKSVVASVVPSPVVSAPVVMPRVIPPVASVAPSPVASVASSTSSRVVSAARQVELDTDALGVLRGELRRTEDALAVATKRYNGGVPERFPSELKDEATYQLRVDTLKVDVARLDGDRVSLLREIALHVKKLQKERQRAA